MNLPYFKSCSWGSLSACSATVQTLTFDLADSLFLRVRPLLNPDRRQRFDAFGTWQILPSMSSSPPGFLSRFVSFCNMFSSRFAPHVEFLLVSNYRQLVSEIVLTSAAVHLQRKQVPPWIQSILCLISFWNSHNFPFRNIGSNFMSQGRNWRRYSQHVFLSDPKWQMLKWEWCRQRASFGPLTATCEWAKNSWGVWRYTPVTGRGDLPQCDDELSVNDVIQTGSKISEPASQVISYWSYTSIVIIVFRVLHDTDVQNFPKMWSDI